MSDKKVESWITEYSSRIHLDEGMNTTGAQVKEVSIKETEYIPKVTHRYPMSAEREMVRVTRAYAGLMIKQSMPYIKEIMQMYKQEERNDSRFDDFSSFWQKAVSKLGEMSSAIGRISQEKFKGMFDRVGKTAFMNSFNEWSRVLNKVYGFAPSQEYYQDYLSNTIQLWTEQNVAKVSELSDYYKQKLAEIIQWGYETKQPLVNVYKKIEDEIGTTKSYAKILGRDQMGTLNAQMTQKEHESIGVTKYMWKTVRDVRVRECHRSFDGKIFSWNNPPEIWYATVTKGIVFTGRRCHPGEDYCCRCTAIPVIDKEKIQNRFGIFNTQ